MSERIVTYVIAAVALAAIATAALLATRPIQIELVAVAQPIERPALRVHSVDLSNVGTGDFHVAFTISTTAHQSSAVIGQRAACAHGVFWDVRMSPEGMLVVETDGGDYTVLTASSSVNDGYPHDIAITRMQGTLAI